MQQEKHPKQILVSSALASTLISFLTNPIDVVKTRLQRDAMECKEQTIHERKSFKPSFRPSFNLRNPFNVSDTPKLTEMRCECMPQNSTLKLIAHIARTEGLRTLANGMKSSMLMSATSHTAFMFLYETVKKAITKITNNNIIMPLSASLLTRLTVTSVLFPLDYVRTMQQSASGESKVSIKDAKFNLKAGYRPLVVRDLVFSAIYWVSIENIRRVIMQQSLQDMKYLDKGQKILLANSISGAISGCMAAVVTLPFDVVKTRMQINENLRTMSSRKVMYDIYSKEGIPALYTGLRQRMFKVSITCSGVLALYEYFNHMLQTYTVLE